MICALVTVSVKLHSTVLKVQQQPLLTLWLIPCR